MPHRYANSFFVILLYADDDNGLVEYVADYVFVLFCFVFYFLQCTIQVLQDFI